MRREVEGLRDMLGLGNVRMLALSHTWLSNSGSKVLDSGVCSKPFMAHPPTLCCLVSHISPQLHSSMPYPLDLHQKKAMTLRSIRSLWILCSQNSFPQNHQCLGVSVVSNQNHLPPEMRNHENNALYFLYICY